MSLQKIGGWYVDEKGRKWGSPSEYEYFQKRAPTLPETRVETGAMEGTVESHPAFGQISAHRVNGSATLYGSDFKHNGYMEITVKRSELHRSLSRDWPSSNEQLISVCLSEAQWATFISSLNMGDGVPCTIDYLPGEPLPQIGRRTNRSVQFKNEIGKVLETAEAEIDAMMKLVDDGKLTKTAMRQHLISAKNNLSSNVSHVADQFGEFVETTIERAKVEVEGYASRVLINAGAKALKQSTEIVETSAAPILIGGEDDKLP